VILLKRLCIMLLVSLIAGCGAHHEGACVPYERWAEVVTGYVTLRPLQIQGQSAATVCGFAFTGQGPGLSAADQQVCRQFVDELSDFANRHGLVVEPSAMTDAAHWRLWLEQQPQAFLR